MALSNVEYSEETYRDLVDYFNGAPIGLHLTGPDGTITRANLAELELLGYRGHEGEYLGHHFAEFHADPDGARKLFDRLLAGEAVLEHEVTLVTRDGKQQKALLYANAKLDGGEFGGIRCFTFPHPDDLRPEIAEFAARTDQADGADPDADRQTFEDLRDFFENSPVNLHIVDGGGLIKHVSRSELHTMGYDEGKYVGQHIARFHADQKVIDGMLENLVGGSPLINFSATLIHSDGSELPVMIYSSPRMRDGSFVNTRCCTVPMPKTRKPLDAHIEVA